MQHLDSAQTGVGSLGLDFGNRHGAPGFVLKKSPQKSPTAPLSTRVSFYVKEHRPLYISVKRYRKQ